MGLALAAVFASCIGIGVSIHAQGVIPLSTHLDVAEPVQEFPVIEQELPIQQQVQDVIQQDSDSELLALLRNTMDQSVKKASVENCSHAGYRLLHLYSLLRQKCQGHNSR